LSHLTLYFRSIYWALYSASSIGYYDILATNPIETYTVTLILLFGCQMLIGLVGAISSEMQSLTTDQILFQTKLENTQALVLRNGLTPEIRESLSCYFHYNWERSHGVDEVVVLSSLPLPLRQAVIKEITGAVLCQIVFFQDCSEGIINAILASLTPRIFIDGDAVVTAGEYGVDFFVIESGCIQVVSADQMTVFVTLGPGNYLGESCLMGLQIQRRTASAYSRGYSYTYALRNIDFAAAISPYPEEGISIIRKIKQGE
jgi:potassium channel